MDTKPEGDHSVEALLRRSLRQSSTDLAVTSACLDAETIAAWADGGLSRRDRAAAEAHAADCSRCQAMVAALVKVSPEPPPLERSWLRSWTFRLLVPLTAGAAAVAIWFAVPGTPSSTLSDKREVQSHADESAKQTTSSELARLDAPRLRDEKPAAPATPVAQPQKPAAPRALPANLGSSCLDFHRRELERQRDALRGFWSLVLPPFLPGGLVLIISLALQPGPKGLIRALIVTAFFASLFTFFAKLNQRAARRLQRKIDELRG